MALIWILALAAGAAPFEARQIERALAALGRTVEPAPEGKVVGEVLIARAEVFVEDEALPTLPNALHALTTEATIRAEVLVRPGEGYSQAAVEETERNLRNLKIFSVAVAVPVRAAAPDRVDILVVTRDQWSLRPEFSLQFSSGRVRDLLVQVAERNLFGQNQRLLGRFRLTPFTAQAGLGFLDHRLFGAPLHFEQAADLWFDRGDGTFEGVTLRTVMARPVYALDQPTGFQLDADVEDRIIRRVRGGAVLRWDDPATEATEALPQMWRAEAVQARALYRWQWAGPWVAFLTMGGGAGRDEATPLDVPAAHRAAFVEDVVPAGRLRVFPSARLDVFRREFRTFTDMAGYGVSEDVQLGPGLRLNLEAPLAALGSTHDALEVEAAIAWAVAPGGALVEATAAGEVRLEDSQALDQALLGRLRLVTPPWAGGRVLLRTDWIRRARNTTRTPLGLGASNGLRGYPDDHLFTYTGQRVRVNLELRTPPLAWDAVHLGGVVFWDGGTVWDASAAEKERESRGLPRLSAAAARLSPRSLCCATARAAATADLEDDTAAGAPWLMSVGLGVRVLFPQIYREVLRVDVATPLSGGFMVRITGGTSQAIPTSSREDGAYDTVGGVPNQP